MNQASSETTAITRPSAGIAEAATFLVGVCLLIVVQMCATHGRSLLLQAPWLDEVHTASVVNAPSGTEFRAAFTRGIEANFPLYYLPFRFFGGASVQTLREASLALTVATLWGLYLLLRRTFSPIAACAGILSFWAIPLIIRHSFEARFYTAWLAATVWYALTLEWNRTTGRRALAVTAVALMSVVASLVHILAVFAVVLVTAGHVLADRRPLKRRLLAVLPALAGPIAVAGCLPLLAAHRQTTGGLFWLRDAPPAMMYNALLDVLPLMPAALLIVGWWVAQFIPNLPDAGQSPLDRKSIAPLAGISCLLLMPLALAMVSLLLQPVLLGRYAIVTAAGAAAAAAFVASHLRRPVGVLLCIMLAAEGTVQMRRLRLEGEAFTRSIDSIIATAHNTSMTPVLFEARHALYPVCWRAPDLTDRCAFLDFEDGPGQPADDYHLFEREMARNFEQVFGAPHVMSWNRVRLESHLVFVAEDDDLSRVQQRFVLFKAERIAPNQFNLTR